MTKSVQNKFLKTQAEHQPAFGRPGGMMNVIWTLYVRVCRVVILYIYCVHYISGTDLWRD